MNIPLSGSMRLRNQGFGQSTKDFTPGWDKDDISTIGIFHVYRVGLNFIRSPFVLFNTAFHACEEAAFRFSQVFDSFHQLFA